MDQERFDRLTRMLVTGQSRRGVLKGLGGGLVAGMLATLGRGDALADVCKANGKACKRGDQCCSGICDGGSGTGSTGKSSGTCVANVPGTCPAGTDACNDGFSNSVFCGADCVCVQTVGGETFCADLNSSDCVACDVDSCGEGKVCVALAEGNSCVDCADATITTGCFSPCPST